MDDPIVAQVLTLLRKTIDSVHGLTRKEYRQIPAIELIALKMMWLSVTKCDAIHLLLTDWFVQEATILLRSLMWDAQRLIYMEQNPKDRVALLYGMGNKHIHNMEGLASTAEEIGLDAKIIREATIKQRRMIEKAKAARGGVKLKRFPAEGLDIARSIGRLSDMLGHKMFSANTHSAALSMLDNVSTNEDGTVNLSSKNTKPGYVTGVAWSASEYLFEGAIATARAQEWGSFEEMQERYGEIRGKFEELSEQKKRQNR